MPMTADMIKVDHGYRLVASRGSRIVARVLKINEVSVHMIESENPQSRGGPSVTVKNKFVTFKWRSEPQSSTTTNLRRVQSPWV
jgi:hypothetical protein